MNYVSFGLETLSTPAFLASPEDIVGTWVKLIRFCAQSENGGRIIGAKDWNERLWAITCALPLGVLNKESPLWSWEGPDLVVLNYPVWSEEKAKRSRAGAAATNSKRWGSGSEKKEGATHTASRSANRSATHTASRSPSRDRSFVRSFDHNVLKGTKKNAATPLGRESKGGESRGSRAGTDLKTQWAATRAEIKRLEEVESESDGNLSAADAAELARLRKQLTDITRQQTGGKP